jgi:formate hydrogenlyase transcriptional activator
MSSQSSLLERSFMPPKPKGDMIVGETPSRSQERTPLETTIGTPAPLDSRGEGAQNESVLGILKLMSAGSPLPEVLTVIARLVESQGKDLFCTIWLPDEEAHYLSCAAAPSLRGFSDHVGRMQVSPKGASCGTAVYRREPVYVTDIFTAASWDDYRHLMVPYGIRSVWSRPLFTSEGKALGTFAILHREACSPDAQDVQLIENASHITGIAIERHMNEQALQRERDRLRLLLEISNSMTSKPGSSSFDREPFDESPARHGVTFARCCFPMTTAGSCA